MTGAWSIQRTALTESEKMRLVLGSEAGVILFPSCRYFRQQAPLPTGWPFYDQVI